MVDEQRRKRSSFTRSLKRIAARIDNTSEFEVEWYDDLFRKKEKTRFYVKALWVFGSWARGALYCGDLDLMVDVEVTEGRLPMTPTLRRALLKGARDVRLYVGKPEENSSGVPVEDAVLIWSVTDRNWKSNIAQIKPDPSADRFARKIDAIPLRSEQLYAEVDVLEKVVDLKNEQILDWFWIPNADLESDSIQWSETAASFYERLKQHCGKKTFQAMRSIIDWFEVNDPIQTWNYDHSSRAAFTINGAFVHVGHPYIDLGRLDHHSCSAIMLVPHLTKRGPNGIWCIRRGTKHTLEKMFKTVSAYALTEKGLDPLVVHAVSDWKEICLIDLFRKKADAEAFAHEISEETEPELSALKVSGRDLLRIISLVDQVDIDGETFAVTLDGTRFDGEEFPRPTPEELKEIILLFKPSMPDK